MCLYLPGRPRRSSRSSAPRSRTTTRSTPAACASRSMEPTAAAHGATRQGASSSPTRARWPTRARRSARTRKKTVALDLVHEAVGPMYGTRRRPPRAEKPRSSSSRKAHYEQHMRVTRHARRSTARRCRIDGFGLRDHSWGPRYWQAIHSYQLADDQLRRRPRRDGLDDPARRRRQPPAAAASSCAATRSSAIVDGTIETDVRRRTGCITAASRAHVKTPERRGARDRRARSRASSRCATGARA